MIHKALYTAEKPPPSDTLFTFQSRPQSSNRYTADLLAFKHSGVARSTTAVARAASLPTIDPSITTLSVFNAAAHAKDPNPNVAIRQVIQKFQKQPGDVGLLLTLIQLYIQSSNYPSATQLLERFLASSEPPIQYNPGLTAILTTLYKAQNRTTAIRSHLAAAAQYWINQSQTPQSLLLAAGASLLDSSSPESQSTAQNIFSSLYSSNSDSPAIKAGYIASHALSSSPEKATPLLLSSLPPVEQTISHVDVARLLATGIPNPTVTAAKTLSLKRKAGAADKGPKKKKRVRKSRLPKKNYEEGKTPDPERWLPLRERSGFRPKKGKKGRKGGGGGGGEGGTQGGVMVADVGGAGAAGSAGTVSTGGGGGGGKKKKGKGGKK